MNLYNFKFKLLIVGICFLSAVNAQQIPHENKVDENCGIVPPVSRQLAEMDDLRKVGRCFNLPPNVKTNEFNFLINYQAVCSCLTTDARDKELYLEHSKKAKLDLEKLPKAPSEQHLSSVSSYLETASDNQLKSFKSSPDEEGTILDTIPPGPINDKPGKDGKVNPLEQCFSFNDYLRSRRAPDTMFSNLLSRTSNFDPVDWSYDKIKEDFANKQKEIYSLETYDPNKPAWKNRNLSATAIRQRINELHNESAEKKSTLAFLYKNPLIKNFFASRAPDSEKSKLFMLVRDQYNKKKNICIISTHPDCINGEVDRASQLSFEAKVKKMISGQENEKFLGDAKSLARVEDSYLLNTPKIELTERNIISLTKKMTGLDPNTCFLNRGLTQTEAEIQKCIEAYAYHCKLVSEFNKRVIQEKSYVVEELELGWADELNTDYKNNANFKAQTKALCYDETRFSKALRQKSFSFFRAMSQCKTESGLAKCQDSHDSYKDYVKLFKEKTESFEEVKPVTSHRVSTDFTPRSLDTYQPKFDLTADPGIVDKKAGKSELSTDTKTTSAEPLETQKPKAVEAEVNVPVVKDAKSSTVVAQAPVTAAIPTSLSSSEVKNDVFTGTTLPRTEETDAAIKNSTSENASTVGETVVRTPVSKTSKNVEKSESEKISATTDTSKDALKKAEEELAKLKKEVSDLKTAQTMKAEQIPTLPIPVSRPTLTDRPNFDRQTYAQAPIQNGNQVSSTVTSNFNTNAKEETKIDERVEAIKNKIPLTDRVKNIEEKDNFVISKNPLSLSVAQAMGNTAQGPRQESSQVLDKDFHIEVDVENSIHFENLKANDQKTLETLEYYLQKNNSPKNAVIVLTDKDGSSLYFSVVRGSTSTVAIPLTLTPQQQVDFARRGLVNRKQRLETLNLLLNPAGPTPVKS